MKKIGEKILKYVTAGMILLMAILTLVFNLVGVKVSSGSYSLDLEINGYDLLLPMGDSSTSSYYNAGYLPLAFIALMVLSVAIAVLVFVGDNEKSGKYIASALGCMVAFTVLYMCIGIHVVSSIKEMLGDLGSTTESMKITTVAFWPFIIMTLVAVAYVLTNKLVIPKLPEGMPVKNVANPAASAEDITATILKYKELLDAGVISEEEYAKIKKDILK